MKPRWEGETVTCSCGEPTQSPSGECSLCESEAVMFSPRCTTEVPAEIMDAARRVREYMDKHHVPSIAGLERV